MHGQAKLEQQNRDTLWPQPTYDDAQEELLMSGPSTGKKLATLATGRHGYSRKTKKHVMNRNRRTKREQLYLKFDGALQV